MKNKNVHPIRYVAGRCGLKPHLIRTWERRYQVIEPERTQSNRRLYTEEDIRRLQLLARAVNAGHAISQVAMLSNDALQEMLNLTFSSRQTVQHPEMKKIPISQLLETAVKAILSLEIQTLETVLAHAAISLPRPRLILDFIEPLYRHIGEQWAAGKIRVMNEHMATVVIRSFLWDLMKSVETVPGAPRIVITTPAGQWHEIGALTIAVTATETGWEALYFGANLPAEEIAAAVDKTGAEAVGLSINHPLNIALMTSELQRLHRYLGDDFDIFAGGPAASSLVSLLNAIGAHDVSNLLQFRQMLETLLCKGRDGMCR